MLPSVDGCGSPKSKVGQNQRRRHNRIILAVTRDAGSTEGKAPDQRRCHEENHRSHEEALEGTEGCCKGRPGREDRPQKGRRKASRAGEDGHEEGCAGQEGSEEKSDAFLDWVLVFRRPGWKMARVATDRLPKYPD